MVLDNDTRGWIMAATSGIACMTGASIICVDLILRWLPGKSHFDIKNSNPFLSAGLSISFGVMIFSSLNSMLPSASKYLRESGFGPRGATLILMGCFLAGAGGIAILSQIVHRFIPHSVIDCDHDHGDEEEDAEQTKYSTETQNGDVVEAGHHHRPRSESDDIHADDSHATYGAISHGSTFPALVRRPSLRATISTTVSQLVSRQKQFCDEEGQCHGFSGPCGQECFKTVQQHRDLSRSKFSPIFGKVWIRPSGTRTVTSPRERVHLLPGVDEYSPLTPANQSYPAVDGHPASLRTRSSYHSMDTQGTADSHQSHSHAHRTHHHHVPTNVFLSLSLQTSIAIALHKLPEGFITYATNHVNPRLGFAVFLALFIHNLTEGFALALPLFLAFNSRWKAILWSAVLGGLTQPLGAAFAALWFRVAGRQKVGEGPSSVVYGALFASTAGIMTMVGLQLFSESLDLTHSKKVCFVFAFVGMGILGLSNALTA